MSLELMAALMQSDWPGNVRELQNYLERIITLAKGEVLSPDPPPPDLEKRRPVASPGGRRLTEVVGRIERRLVRDALRRSGGNQSVAAKELGITEQSFRYRLRKYGLPGRRNRRY